MEFAEMVHFLLGRFGFVVCHVAFAAFLLSVCWGYVTIFSSTCANLFHAYVLRSSTHCIIEEDPDSTCYMWFYIFVAIYAAIVFPIECLNASSLARFQTFFTVYRILAFGMVFLACGISMAKNGSVWYNYPADNGPNPPFAVSFRGVPLLLYASLLSYIGPYVLPDALQPLGHAKKSALTIVIAALTSAFVFYMCSAVFLSLTLGSDVLPYSMLNFARFGNDGFIRNSEDNEPATATGWFLFMKLFILFFPIMDLISVYPIVVGTVSQNIFAALPQRYRDWSPKWGLLILKYFVSIIPFIFGTAFPSLKIMIGFSGWASVLLAFILPAAMQIQSQRRAKAEWRTPDTRWWSHPALVWSVLIFGFFVLIGTFVYLIASLITGES
jgi:hypothetical protein